MKKNVQVVKMSKSILNYFKMVMNLENEREEYRKLIEQEFINELTKSLNHHNSIGEKEIEWVD